mmetsp:Transcript_21903/g.69927  ORF Transcript_21903/g.69927 Transcript_21903/m.69927 type:complete len:321 (+) Transcript_21903:379-1341(+)
MPHTRPHASMCGRSCAAASAERAARSTGRSPPASVCVQRRDAGSSAVKRSKNWRRSPPASWPASPTYSIVRGCLRTPQRTPISEKAPSASMAEPSSSRRTSRSRSSSGSPAGGSAASMQAKAKSSRASSVRASPGGQSCARHWLTSTSERTSRAPTRISSSEVVCSATIATDASGESEERHSCSSAENISRFKRCTHGILAASASGSEAGALTAARQACTRACAAPSAAQGRAARDGTSLRTVAIQWSSCSIRCAALTASAAEDRRATAAVSVASILSSRCSASAKNPQASSTLRTPVVARTRATVAFVSFSLRKRGSSG